MQIAHAVLVVFGVTLLAFASTSSIFGHDSEVGLLNYMARSNDILQQDPARSLNCFNKYIPLINEIANNYETNFKACLNDSEAASARADEATLQQRNELANAVEASCNILTQCPENEAVEGIFQCYIDGGSANIKTMYTINSNASQELAALREQYYLIKNTEYKCTNETKRVYEKQSAEAYAGLNNCILGNDDAVTEETSTTAEPSTVEATIVTTTSAEPETSENPETTVSASESTEKVPEDSTSESIEDTTSDSSTTATTIEAGSTEIVPEETTSTEGPQENTSQDAETLDDYYN